MKRIGFFSAVALFAAVLFSGCTIEEPNIDESLLIGKWQSGTLYEVYKADYTGSTWDESEDVAENEAQKFTWTLEKSTLTQIHIMEMTGVGTIPKVYKVTQLNDSILVYEDEFGSSKSFKKVVE